MGKCQSLEIHLEGMMVSDCSMLWRKGEKIAMCDGTACLHDESYIYFSPFLFQGTKDWSEMLHDSKHKDNLELQVAVFQII